MSSLMRCCIEGAGGNRLSSALLLAAGCGPAPPPSLDLPVYFTCDTRGRLEPCGCFAGQFGGLTRLKTVLDAEAPAGAFAWTWATPSAAMRITI